MIYRSGMMMIILMLSCLCSCQKGAKKMSEMEQLLQKRAVTLNEMKKDLKIESGYGYEKMKSLSRAIGENPKIYYYFDQAGKCVMIYSGDEALLKKISIKKIVEKYGAAEQIVRSRMGKRGNHHLYPTKGFAFSELDGKIGILEIFPDMTLKQYLDQIHQPVGPYRK